MTRSSESYELRFLPAALAEWHKLDNSVRQPLTKRLKTRLLNPRVENERLSGDLSSCYKLKDNKSGNRLVYVVLDEEQAVIVIAIGKREGLAAYDSARDRIPLIE